MHVELRTGPIRKIVLHDNEGPEGVKSAAELAHYLINNGPLGGGYQAVFDQPTTVVVQADNVVCWANGAVNHESIDGCIVGYAAQSPAQWADAFDKGALEQAAQWFAAKCLQYGIPARWLTAAELRTSGSMGMTTHGDLTAAGYSGTEGHTDPGPNFPRDAFLARVRTIILPPAPPINWTAVAALGALLKAVTTRPVRLGDSGQKVGKVQALLAKRSPAGTHVGQPGHYDAIMAAVVKRFKVAHGLRDTNPNAVGRACLLALIKR